MKQIGVIANLDKPNCKAVLARLAARAKERGFTLVATEGAESHLPEARTLPIAEWGATVDVVIALGGDGTMLHAVRMLDSADTPVLGVNIGSLGFLTSVTEAEVEHAVDMLAAGTYSVSERSLLRCSVMREAETIHHSIALNDMVVGWGASSRALMLRLRIDAEEVAQYLCDGLIVSTPTGSTGHSLSAGGPVVHPAAPVMCINVICPHTLGARPLVLSDTSMIEIEVLDIPEHKRPLLSADGQGEFVLAVGDGLAITRYEPRARFVHLPEYSYFSVLRQKLHWRGSAR